MTKFGWCCSPIDRPRHENCPGVLRNSYGVAAICGCECHEEGGRA